MAKNIHFLLLAVLSAALMLTTSCGESGQKEPDTLSVSPTELSFTADDVSTKLLSIKSNTTWVVSASADWILLDKTSGSGNAPLAVKVSSNGGDNREGTII